MVDGNSAFPTDTVSGIERARKNGWELGSEKLIEMTHGLSRVFPALKEDSGLSNITSAFVAKVLMGGYKDTSELGIATGERILLLITQDSLRKSFLELGVDTEAVESMLGGLSQERKIPSIDTLSPAALAWYAKIKLESDLGALGVNIQG